MDTELITLAGILEYLNDDVNTIRLGQLKFKSDFVLHLRIDERTVNAEVRAYESIDKVQILQRILDN